jgi:actin-like ATPase involved in cell morphogenesis
MAAGEMSLGISFGTAFCRAAWVASRTPAFGDASVICDDATPAAFYGGPGGPAFGSAALRMFHDETSRQSVRGQIARDLGNRSLYHIAGQDYSPSQVTSLILRDVRERAERKAGSVFARTVVAYPVWFDAVAETALKDAISAAGLTNATLITQAHATTVAFRRAGHALGDRVLVVDIGAVSTDLSVLALEPSGSYAGAHRPRSLAVGGDDLDHTLYAHVAEAAKQQAGHAVLDAVGIDLGALQACRLAKEALSRSDEATFEYTTRNGSATALRIPLTRVELEGLARPKLEEVFRAASEVLAAAANRGRPIGTIILTGGGSLMPLAQRLAHAGLSVDAVLVDRDGTAAAVGAAWAVAQSTLVPQAKVVSMVESTPPTNGSPTSLASVLSRDDCQVILDEAKKRPVVFLIVGRTGVGKSSTINSLVERVVAEVGHTRPTTFNVTPYPYEQDGVKFTFVDTPGLCDDLPEKNKDQVYLARMQASIKQFDSLWFVTQLNDRRVSSDEMRAIKLISEAFTDKAKVWERGVIIFTNANTPTDDPYPINFQNRTEVIREVIAEYSGKDVAVRIPAVAIENKSDTTPDGKLWRGELYVKVLSSMSRDGIITFFLGTSHLLPPPPRRQSPGQSEREERPRDSRRDYYDEDRSERRNRYAEREHVEVVERIVVREVTRTFEERGGSFGAKIDQAVGTTSFFADTGKAIGRFLDKWFG